MNIEYIACSKAANKTDNGTAPIGGDMRFDAAVRRLRRQSRAIPHRLQVPPRQPILVNPTFALRGVTAV